MAGDQIYVNHVIQNHNRTNNDDFNDPVCHSPADSDSDDNSNLLTDRKLSQIASRISVNTCKRLALEYLGLRQTDVENIEWETGRNSYEFILGCLRRWRELAGITADLDYLQECIQKIQHSEASNRAVPPPNGGLFGRLPWNIRKAENAKKELIAALKIKYETIMVIKKHPLRPEEVGDLPFVELQLKQRIDNAINPVNNVTNPVLQRELAQQRGQMVFRGHKQAKLIRNYLDIFEMPLPRGASRRYCIIEGMAGSGKSTLAKRLAYDWATNNNPVSTKYQLVIYLELKNIDLCKNIVDEIARLLLPKDKQNSNTKDHLKTIMATSTILFVFDGFDEISVPDERREQAGCITAYDVMFGTAYLHADICVMTRPHKKCDIIRLCVFAEPFLNIIATGFTREKTVTYINMYFGQSSDNPTTARRILAALARHGLDDLALLPVTLLFVCFLWKSYGEEKFPRSLPELYSSLVEHLLQHHRSRKATGGAHSTDGNSVHEIDVHGFYKALGEPCWNALRQGFLHIRKEELEKRLGGEEKLKTLLDAGLLVHDTVFEDQQEVYSFLHKSVQERCALDHLLRSQRKQPKWCLKNLNTLESLLSAERVLVFAFGCLEGPGAGSLGVELIYHMKYLTVANNDDRVNDVSRLQAECLQQSQQIIKYAPAWILRNETNGLSAMLLYTAGIDTIPAPQYLDRDHKEAAMRGEFSERRPRRLDSNLDQLVIRGGGGRAPPEMDLQLLAPSVNCLCIKDIDLSGNITVLNLPEVLWRLEFIRCPLSKESIKLLLEQKEKLSKVTDFRLLEGSVKTECALQLAELVINMPKLSSLEFVCNPDFEDQGVSQLQLPPSILILWLSGCGITESCLPRLCSMMKTLKHLEWLELSDNKLGLVENKWSPVAKLNGGLASGISLPSNLTKLSLNGCGLSIRSSKFVENLLNGLVKLAELDLSNNDLKELISDLKLLPTLTRLALRNCCLGVGELDQMNSILTSLVNLQELHLSYNPIASVLDKLFMPRYIKEVHLTQADITEDVLNQFTKNNAHVFVDMEPSTARN